MKARSARPSSQRSPKYIFVVGGVMSGVGKGVTASAVAALLQASGLRVTALKIDPYINVDAGTMNPTEHGEVFVLEDGLETDQDMGNYERFLNTSLPSLNYMTTGSVYLSVIQKERALEYKGKNVQVVPDIPKEVIRRINVAAEAARAEVVIVEVGGTIGEYENILFLEAVRMLQSEKPEDVAVMMVSYLPVPGSVGEMKTKPTQHAARTLGSAGVRADIIVARSAVKVDDKRKEKISTFCNVKIENVISAPDVTSIYNLPEAFAAEGVSEKIMRLLGMRYRGHDLTAWQKFTQAATKAKRPVRIAIVGKYFKTGDFVLSDVYLSVIEALKFSAYTQNLKPEITYFSASDFERAAACSQLLDFDGVLIPGGFGATGINGKLNVIRYIREQKIPFLGICYGMQLAVVEYARSVLGWRQAHTTEIDPDTPKPVINILEGQRDNVAAGKLGGTLRRGNYEMKLKVGSMAAKAYASDSATERHRHRFEVNPEYVAALSEAGLNFSATSPKGDLMEMIELPGRVHPFFVGIQAHPELTARPLSPHPLFSAFIKASARRKK